MNSQKIQMIGIPFDAKSSYQRGAALGPSRIREEIGSDAYNAYDERMHLVLGEEVLIDSGNIQSSTFEDIYPEIKNVLSPETKPLFLGGDHSITFPLVQNLFERHGPLHILHFDAHSDLYPDYFGDPFSHACPFARILEAGYCTSLTQVGIRAMTPIQQLMVEKHHVDVYRMTRLDELNVSTIKGPLYISLDLDGIDPAYAPGVSHRESGGLTPRQVIGMLQQIQVPVVGADLVELNPLNDHAGITAALCVKLVRELIGAMVSA
jgi:agmatinase